MSRELEAFALKAAHYGRLTGISLGVHAIRDAFLLLHAGVGCKYKAAAQIAQHDWARQPHRREGWTEVGDAALIRGAAGRIGPYVRSWYARQKPGLMLVSPASFLELVGEDLAAVVAEADRTVGCPVRLVSGSGFAGDLFAGYREVLRVVLSLVPWDEVKPQPGSVALVGYLFDRYESDHAASLHQARGLLQELGLTLETVLLCGQPLGHLQRAARAATLVVLPYARGLEDALAATGRRVVHTELPLSLRGTTAWLHRVGEAVGVPRRRITASSDRLSGYADRELEILRRLTRGEPSAVFADTPLAAGLCAFLDEVGLPPRLVGLRDRTLGGAAALGKVDAEVLADPSVALVRRRLKERLRAGDLRALVGSATEHAIVRSRELAEDEPPGSGLRAGLARLARIKVGFPSSGDHALQPQPLWGYGGAVSLGQRLLDALTAERRG